MNQGFALNPRPRKLLFNPANTKFERVNNQPVGFHVAILKRNFEVDGGKQSQSIVNRVQHRFLQVRLDQLPHQPLFFGLLLLFSPVAPLTSHPVPSSLSWCSDSDTFFFSDLNENCTWISANIECNLRDEEEEIPLRLFCVQCRVMHVANRTVMNVSKSVILH